MTGLRPWVAKAVLSALYWLACLYVGTGLFVGDRLTADGIVPAAPPVPRPVFVLLAIGLYVALSILWDRTVSGRRSR